MKTLADRERTRRWKKANPDKVNEHMRRYNHKLRREIISYYSIGGFGCKCGVIDVDLLVIDHIDDTGAEHRRSLNIQGGKKLYTWIKQNNFPSGFQTLCWNCNLKKMLLKNIEKHKNKRVVKEHRHMQRMKYEIFNKYSDEEIKCKCCGITDIDVLTIDHVNNNGIEHRSIGIVGNMLYKWLKKNGFPSGYQVLCLNDNIKKEIERRREYPKIGGMV